MKNLLIGLLALGSISAFGSRPNLEVDFSALCVCNNGLSLSGPQYKEFCQDKKYSHFDLFATTSVGPNISLNPDFITEGEQFGSLYNWCTKNIADETLNPKCKLSFKSKGNVVWVDFYGSKASNNFTASLAHLPRNTKFEVRLIETTSGAKSKPALLFLR